MFAWKQSRSTPGQFKAGMRSLAGAVNIVTSAHAGHRYGMTATAVCSATADPPTVPCASTSSRRRTAPWRRRARSASTCCAPRTGRLSTAFSGAQSGEARFKNGNWTRLATGSPALVDALVSFDCRVVKKIAHGTHTVFLGQVEQMLLGQKGKPLLYSEASTPSSRRSLHGRAAARRLDYWGF